MSTPLAVTELVAELADEIRQSSVEVHGKSKAVIWMNDDDEANEEGGITLSSKDCALVFHSIDTATRLIDALGDVEEASLSLFDVTVTHAVQDFLERSFVAVDEG